MTNTQLGGDNNQKPDDGGNKFSKLDELISYEKQLRLEIDTKLMQTKFGRFMI